jgi:serine/threonine protein kinase
MSEVTTEAAGLSVGEIVAGKYRLDRVLGRGGMGLVMAATHLQLQQRVALKFLRADMLQNAQVVARFTREAQAAARIQGPHVARVLDVGELPSGAPYMVMEYLDGEDLERTLRRRGALPIPEAVDILLEGAEAVAEAHTLGIVHRDLKPANLFLARYPGGRQIVKVLDFGISKVQEPAGSPGLTQPAAMFGSPPYMAPEQVRSARAADTRSDIWSLGAVLYELLTQSLPFPAESYQAQFAAILLNEPASPRTLRPELPPALDAAILRCLHKDPAQRFQEVASLAFALAPFGSPRSAEVPARIARVISTAATGRPVSPTAMAEGAAPPALPEPARPLSGPATVMSAATSEAAGPSPAQSASVREPAAASPAPAPVARDSVASFRGEVVPSSPVAAASAGGRRARLAIVALIAVPLAIAAVGTARWLGTRAPHGPASVAGGPSATRAVPAPAAGRALPAPPQPATTPPPLGADVPPTNAPPRPVPAPLAGPTPTVVRHHDSAPRPRERTSPAAVLPPACAELLARESLGETLTPQEQSTYARACQRH